MTTPAGRGRGYTGRNKDIRKNLENQIGAKVPLSSQPPVVNQFQTPVNPRLNANSYFNQQVISQIASSMMSVGLEPQNVTEMTKGYISKSIDNYENDVFADDNVQSVLYIDEKYTYLIEQINVLSPADDGILTNQKIRHIESVIVKLCTQAHQLRPAMDAIASAAILDSNNAKKVSKMISFSRVQLHQQKLHSVFLHALRDKVDGLEIYLEGADQYLINASSLLTDIYTESKLMDSEDIVMLTHFIIDVFISLLECNTPAALKALNVHLMMYGKDLYPKAPEKFDNISLSVRKQIIGRQPPPPACRIWLALLSDQCLYCFKTLPQYLQDFYGKHLDESTHEEPRDKRFGSMSSETCNSKLPHDQKMESKIKEKRSSIKSDSSDKWSNTSNGEKMVKNTMQDEVFEERSVHHAYESTKYSDCYTSESELNGQMNHERKPRPILGAGSRMIQAQKNDDFNESNYNYNTNNSEDIPKFCPSVPPPNYKPKNSTDNSAKANLSGSQDGIDFWNYPPPKLPPANLNRRKENSNSTSALSKRLDLNSWRQQIKPMNEHFDGDVDDEKTKNEDVHKMEEFHSRRRERNDKDDSISDNFSLQHDSYRDNGENDKNWSRMNKGDKKSGDKKDNPRVKKESEDKESYWKRKDSDNESKIWDSKTDLGSDKSKSSGRRDSRGGSKKKDTMEVSRKASYWTHDDRCDKDYDG